MCVFKFNVIFNLNHFSKTKSQGSILRTICPLVLFFQWAKIVLVVEQSVTTKERQKYQIKYSQPAMDGRRAFPVRWYQSVSSKNEPLYEKTNNLGLQPGPTQIRLYSRGK